MPDFQIARLPDFRDISGTEADARARIAAQVAKNAEESAAAASEEIPVEVAQEEAPAAGASEGEQA